MKRKTKKKKCELPLKHRSPGLWICAPATSTLTASRSAGTTQLMTSSSTDSPGHHSQVATQRRSVTKKCSMLRLVFGDICHQQDAKSDKDPPPADSSTGIGNITILSDFLIWFMINYLHSLIIFLFRQEIYLLPLFPIREVTVLHVHR